MEKKNFFFCYFFISLPFKTGKNNRVYEVNLFFKNDLTTFLKHGHLKELVLIHLQDHLPLHDATL